MRKTIIAIIFVFAIMGTNHAVAQEATKEGKENQIVSNRKQHKADRIKRKEERKQKKAEEKAIKEHHKRLQSKAVLKRMKKNKKRDKQSNTKNVN